MSLPKVKLHHLTDGMHEYLLQSRHTKLHFAASRCFWCNHDWHRGDCPVYNKCHCDMARERLDDTWRPPLTHTPEDHIRRMCADTGVDGYTAKRCVGTIGVPSRATWIKNLLYGGKAP